MNRLLTPAARTAALFLLCLLAAGPTAAAGTSSASPGRPASSNPTLQATLVRGVASALRANQRLAVESLWTDELPPNAGRSTGGPALAALRASASGRRQQLVRVRVLHQSYRIVLIRLDRSHRHATAVVHWTQELAPSHLDGVPIGRPLELCERARIELHRIRSSYRFVVWNLSLQT